jgi:hypothetical protein
LFFLFLQLSEGTQIYCVRKIIYIWGEGIVIWQGGSGSGSSNTRRLITSCRRVKGDWELGTASWRRVENQRWVKEHVGSKGGCGKYGSQWEEWEVRIIGRNKGCIGKECEIRAAVGIVTRRAAARIVRSKGCSGKEWENGD